MTDNERDVLQAAFDLAEAQHGLDCGSPAQGLRRKAMSALMDACAEIAMLYSVHLFAPFLKNILEKP